MRVAAALSVAVALWLPGVPVAQEVPVIDGPLLVIRQDRLYDTSAFGRAAQARLESASRDLIAENSRIEAELEAEERALTDRRAGLPAAEFRALADAFNAKVEGIRAAQDTKSRALTRSRDDDRQRFLQAAVPVLADLMRDKGASVILDQQTVFLSLENVDVTDEAVARIDASLGDGSAVPAPAPAPDPAP